MKYAHALRALTCGAAALLGLGPLAGQAQNTLNVGPGRAYATLHDAVAAGAVTSGTTVQLDDATYTDKTVIDGVSNVTITSASGRTGGVVFDGGSQDNLANRKAIMLVENCPGLAIVGLRFKNAGDGSAQGNGGGNQAGISYENSTGAARVSYCSFDNCVTGIFGRDNSTALDLTIDHCDFGYEVPNGQARDGLSHDAYIGGIHSLTASDNNWYGNPYANNCKTRALSNTISGGYNANGNGRCVEMAYGGQYQITGGIYVARGSYQQPFDYGENTNNGAYDGTISGITLRIAVGNAQLWNKAAGTTMAFVNTTQEWYGTGSINLTLVGPGAITGLATSGTATAAAPPAAPGPVSSSGGGPVTPPAPTVSSFAPASGPGGTRVTVTGTDFTGATGTTLNGLSVSDLSVLSDTSLQFTVPAGASSGPVAVTTAGGNGRSAGAFTVTAPAPALRTPENPSGTAAGLAYAYYETGSLGALPDFAALTPTASGPVANFDLSPRKRDNDYAFRYSGFVTVPTDGNYTFYTSSDDGSQLFIGSQLVVDNDGLHSNQERSGQIGLKAGTHALTVTFFQRGGDQLLGVRYAGPGLDAQAIPAAALSSVPAPAPGGALANGVYRLLARHSGKALDVFGGGGANGTPVGQWAAGNNNPNQQWVIALQSDGAYTLTHQGTNARLDVAGNSDQDYGVVWQYSANDSDAQRWFITATDNGYYKLIHKGTNKALDVINRSLDNGAGVQQWEYGGGLNQQWQFERLDAPTSAQAAAPASAAEARARATAGGRTAVELYPNPAREQLTISLVADAEQLVQVEVRDALARRVTGASLRAVAGPNQLRLPLGALPAGVYAVTVQVGGTRSVHRLVVAP